MIRASQMICVSLISAGNPACDVFPSGVELEIVLELLTFTPSMWLSEFHYGTQQEYCIPCLDRACLNDQFWDSRSSMVTVRSVSYFSIVTPGYMIQRQQDD